MNDTQRASQVSARNGARRDTLPQGPIIDTFVLPSARVRPSIFLWLNMGLRWSAGLAVAAVAVIFMVYPRDSLITALTAVKIVKESFHEAFDPPKPKALPPANGRAESQVAENNTQGQRSEAKAKRPAQPKNASAVASAPPGHPANAEETPQATSGGAMVINTPTGNGSQDPPKMALTLVIPPGGGGGGSAPLPTQSGPAPTSITINNNGSGTGEGGGLPPITVTQVGGSVGGEAPPTPGSTGGQPPPNIVVNGKIPTSTNVMLQGSEQPAEETSSGATAGLHRIVASSNNQGRPDWPRQIGIQGTPAVMALERSNGSRHEYALQTDHYEFNSETKLGADVVRELSRVFEATYELNKALPLGLHPSPEKDRPRFIARIFSHDADYFAAGGMPGSAGTYSRDQSCILVPVSSMGVKVVNGRVQTDRTESTETLIHEITHQMMNKWLPLLPRWYAEGSAEYVAMADYLHGRFFLNQMEDRLRLNLRRRGQSSRDYRMLRPGELMTLDGKSWGKAVAANAAGASLNYASASLLTYYFYHLDGNGDCAAMLKYLSALKQGVPEVEAVKILLGERSMADLERDVVNAFEQHNIHLSIISNKSVATK